MLSIKVLLINVRIDFSAHVPYGVIQIAAVLEKEGYDVRVIDLLFKNWDISILREYNPDIIGISYMTVNLANTKKIISDIKKYNNKLLIITGGIHPSVKPVEAIKNLGIDLAVVGEGEIVIPEILKEFKKKRKKRNLKKVKGIVFKDEKGRVVKTQRSKQVQDLNSLPFPARHLINMESYLIPPGYIRSLFLNRVLTLYTTRGCPYMCSFCAVPIMFQGKIRFRSIKKVVTHLHDIIKTYSPDGIYFSDEVFTVNKKRAYSLASEMKKINLPWGCQTRVDLVNKSLLRHFANCGCKQIDFGVESGSDRILKVMRKNVSRRDIINAFKATRESGLRSFATITIGHPTETVNDLEKTMSLLKIIKPNFTLTNYLTPLPGTYSYHWGVKKGKINPDYYKNMNYHFHAADKPFVNISDIPDNVLMQYKKKIDRLTFKWNYLSMVNLHNFRYLLSMIYYNITDIKTFKNIVKDFYKTKNIDKTITKLLYNYQQRLVKNSV